MLWQAPLLSEKERKRMAAKIQTCASSVCPKYALQFKQDLKNREKEDKKKNTNNHKNESSYLDGGEGEIRTLAPVSQPTPLAGEPLRPTWVLLRMC